MNVDDQMKNRESITTSSNAPKTGSVSRLTALTRNKKLAWLCVFLWMCLIFAFSGQAHSGEITGAYLGDYNFSVRKCAHMCEYCILSLLSLRAISLSKPAPRWQIALYAFVLCVFYAMTDEFHQSFVPGRTATINDVIIDSTGAAIGLIVSYLISAFRRPLAR